MAIILIIKFSRIRKWEREKRYWIKITSIIAKELENHLDGVLILYGTDTMACLFALPG